MGTRQLTVLGVAGVLLAGLLAGCASGNSGSSASSPGASMSATPSPSANPPTPPGDPSASASSLPPGLGLPSGSTRPAPTAGQQTLTGQVEEGVARGCLVLRDEGGTGTYQLMDGDPAVVYAGARVSVTGHVVTGVMSYCMQGRMFQVTEAHKLP